MKNTLSSIVKADAKRFHTWLDGRPRRTRHNHRPITEQVKIWNFVTKYANFHNFTVFVAGKISISPNRHVIPSPVSRYPFNWDGINMWVTADPEDALHEVTHHMVCNAARPDFIECPEYGLGGGPGTHLSMISISNQLRKMSTSASFKEELAVCLLSGYVAEQLIGISPHPTWDSVNIFSLNPKYSGAEPGISILKKTRLLDTRGKIEKDIVFA